MTIETSKNIPFSDSAPAIEGLFVKETERMPGERRLGAYSTAIEGMRKTFAQAYWGELSPEEMQGLEEVIAVLDGAHAEAVAAREQQRTQQKVKE